MTDLSDQVLIEAGLELLRADEDLTVYDGAVPNPRPDVRANPYVLIYATVDYPSDDRANPASGRSAVRMARWICHCVGANGMASRAVAERVRTQLLDQRITVPGMATGLIQWEQSNPPLRDETTNQLVMDSVVVYRLFATT